MNFYSTYEPVSHPHFFPPPRLSPHSQIHLLVAKSWSPKIALPSEVTPSNRSPHISLSRILRELYITAAMPSSTSVALAAGASALLVAAEDGRGPAGVLGARARGGLAAAGGHVPAVVRAGDLLEREGRVRRPQFRLRRWHAAAGAGGGRQFVGSSARRMAVTLRSPTEH